MTSKLPAFLMRATFRKALGELLDWMEGAVRPQKNEQIFVGLLGRPPPTALSYGIVPEPSESQK